MVLTMKENTDKSKCSNVFYLTNTLKLKYVQCTMTQNREEQQTFIFKKLELERV